MSKNFFAALDDSGDEGPATLKTSKAVEKKPVKSKPKVAEPSRVDERRRPNQNDRNTKYGRGGRAPVRDGKRAYDRRSGTGRGREIKKGGGGAHNWGSDKNEARLNQGHVEEGAPEEKDAADETENNTEEQDEAVAVAAEEPEEPEPEPEEDKTMSYEEYLETKADFDNEAFAPVKEREVSNEFAGMKVSKKEEEGDFMMMGGGKQKKTKKKGNQKAKNITPDFRISSGDDRRRDGGGRGGRGRGRGFRGGGRDGRGRGGRGSGRGGRGQGGGRGGGDSASGALNVMDQSAFPSL